MLHVIIPFRVREHAELAMGGQGPSLNTPHKTISRNRHLFDMTMHRGRSSLEQSPHPSTKRVVQMSIGIR